MSIQTKYSLKKIGNYKFLWKLLESKKRRPEKMAFPKESLWNMIFHVLLGKVIFVFLEDMILPLGRKKKDDLSQKIHGNMIFFSNVLKRWSFQKGSRWDMIFLVLSGNVVLFSQKHVIFSLNGKWERDDLSQEIHGNMTFSI